jgi:hypothetical protein
MERRRSRAGRCRIPELVERARARSAVERYSAAGGRAATGGRSSVPVGSVAVLSGRPRGDAAPVRTRREQAQPDPEHPDVLADADAGPARPDRTWLVHRRRPCVHRHQATGERRQGGPGHTARDQGSEQECPGHELASGENPQEPPRRDRPQEREGSRSCAISMVSGQKREVRHDPAGRGPLSGPGVSDPQHLHDLVAVVIDHLHRHLAGARPRERA